MNQISFVDINQFYIEPVKKRGNYKKHPKPVPVVEPWTELKNIYEKLSWYFDLPLLHPENTVITNGIFRAYCSVYEEGIYTYYGEEFEGEFFPIFEAEIIGTENMYIEDRLAVHKAALSYLEGGATIEEAEKLLKSEFKEVFISE